MVTNTKNVDSKFGKYQNGLFMILIGLFWVWWVGWCNGRLAA
jgi:hypothetical protein